MIGFLLKKTFFDIWDNAFRLALLNIGFIASVLIFPLIHRVLEELLPLFSAFSGVIPSAVSGALFFLGAIWCSIYLAAAALCVKNISDYSVFDFKDFKRALFAVYPCGIAYGVFFCVTAVLFIFVIPFYLLMNNPAGILITSILFWTVVVSAAAFQYFFAVRARLAVKNAKIIKKCFLLFIDNPLFFIGTACLTLIFLAISAFIAFLLPGPAGAMLFLDEALRLRLLKYDWLEKNAEAGRKYIPWDTVLAEEREKNKGRTIKNSIFPWKD
ncbi:MAG: hypothetical protein LBB22_00645 [Treponema sp.]|jgi:hypothetical protein|nr:hypothetical protein [Treponema sp.]